MQPIYYTVPTYWWNSLLVAINSCVRVEMAIITMYEKLLVEFLARGD